MASVNYYSFFDGWDAGVEADRKQAAEERLAEKNRQSNELYTLALPSQKLASEKAAEALDSYLFTAGLRKKHLENQAALAMGQHEAFAGILPQLLAIQPQVADNYFQTQLNGLNSATLKNESTQRQNTMVAANPITLDPAVRDNMARLLAAGVDVDISAFGLSKEEQAAMNVAQKAAFVADPYKYRAAVQAEQQKTLQAVLKSPASTRPNTFFSRSSSLKLISCDSGEKSLTPVFLDIPSQVFFRNWYLPAAVEAFFLPVVSVNPTALFGWALRSLMNPPPKAMLYAFAPCCPVPSAKAIKFPNLVRLSLPCIAFAFGAISLASGRSCPIGSPRVANTFSTCEFAIFVRLVYH